MDLEVSADKNVASDSKAVKGEWATVASGTTGKVSPIRLWGGVAFLLLLFGIFARDLVLLFRLAGANELHSHIILIPFISAYLVYIQRPQTPRAYRTDWLPAICLFLLGAAALTLARYPGRAGEVISYNDTLSLSALSLILFSILGGFFFLG